LGFNISDALHVTGAEHNHAHVGTIHFLSGYQDLMASPIPQEKMRKPRVEGIARGESCLSTPTLIYDDPYRMNSPSRAGKHPTTISTGLSVFTTTSGYVES
jgi:hypothetical protein